MMATMTSRSARLDSGGVMRNLALSNKLQFLELLKQRLRNFRSCKRLRSHLVCYEFFPINSSVHFVFLFEKKTI